MHGTQRAAFWLTVAGVSLLAPVAFNLAADSKIGDVVPGFRTLNHFTTRKNG